MEKSWNCVFEFLWEPCIIISPQIFDQSPTPVCCKIQEHIVTSKVLNDLDEHHTCILTICQHGFRARHSCETLLLTLAQELIEGLDNSHQHDLIILTFLKPFGHVPHEQLMVKLGHYGIRGANQRWIQAFPTDRT